MAARRGVRGAAPPRRRALHPRPAPDHPWILTTDWTYIRFHGPDALRQKYPAGTERERLAPSPHRLGGWLADGLDVYAYFNNDWEAFAPRNALWLKEHLSN